MIIQVKLVENYRSFDLKITNSRHFTKFYRVGTYSEYITWTAWWSILPITVIGYHIALRVVKIRITTHND